MFISQTKRGYPDKRCVSLEGRAGMLIGKMFLGKTDAHFLRKSMGGKINSAVLTEKSATERSVLRERRNPRYKLSKF